MHNKIKVLYKKKGLVPQAGSFAVTRLSTLLLCLLAWLSPLSCPAAPSDESASGQASSAVLPDTSTTGQTKPALPAGSNASNQALQSGPSRASAESAPKAESASGQARSAVPSDTSAPGQIKSALPSGNGASKQALQTKTDAPQAEGASNQIKSAAPQASASSAPQYQKDNVQAAPERDPAQAGNEAPVDGGKLFLGTTGEPSNLIPYLTSDAPSHEVADMIFVAPLRYSKDLVLEPWAAESYEVLDGGKRFVFTLRKGIRWEDGEELTADDVVFTYKLVADPKTASPYAEDFMRIKEIKALDRYRFEATYDEFFARAESTFASVILPKHILEGQDLRTTPFARKPVGAGPYTLKNWEPGSRLTLAANPGYFMGRPHIDEVVYRIIPDSATMFMELRAGKIDMMGLTPEQYLHQTATARWNERFSKYRYLGSVYVFLGYNMEHPYFQDRRVRLAISKALNRDEIVKGALFGQGIPAFGPYKPGTPYYHPTLKPVRQDIEGAKALLEEAGFADSDGDGVVERDGKPFAFTILTNQGNNERVLTATIIQSELKKIGVKVSVRTVEWAAFIREFVNKGRFDALILGWTITPDPDLYPVWHSSRAVPGGLNFTHFKNAELDEAIDKGRRTPVFEERFAFYKKAQEILAREQPYCFLYVPYALPVVSSRFHGIQPALAGISWNMDEWWVPKSLQENKVSEK